MNDSIPVYHAWLAINGKLIDPTLRWHNGPLQGKPLLGSFPQDNPENEDPGRDDRKGDDPEREDRKSLQFFGVLLALDQVLHVGKHHAHVPIIGDWLCRWPLLRQAAGEAPPGKRTTGK